MAVDGERKKVLLASGKETTIREETHDHEHTSLDHHTFTRWLHSVSQSVWRASRHTFTYIYNTHSTHTHTTHTPVDSISNNTEVEKV